MKTRYFQIAAKQWERLVQRTKDTSLTFRQVRGLFIGQHGYEPPGGLPLMPTNELDWFRRVGDVIG